MEFLIRLTQAHESFRLPEIEALAEQEGIPISVLEYSLEVSMSLRGECLRVLCLVIARMNDHAV